MEKSRRFCHQCEYFPKKTFPSFFKLAFWPSGAYFSGCHFLGELEQIRASVWQSERLVVIPVVCKAPEGDTGIACWDLDWGAQAPVCVCFQSFFWMWTVSHWFAFKGHVKKKIAGSRECLLILTWLLPLGIKQMNKVFVSASWGSALQQAGWILCRLRGMRLFSWNCQVSSKTKLLTRNTKCMRGCT